MKKELREKVYNKCGGRCAYCGIDIAIDGFQVDHKHPQYLGGSDCLENLLPSCRSCNATKSTYTIEKFRERITGDIARIRRDSSKFRILERFGAIEVTGIEVKFYFEWTDKEE